MVSKSSASGMALRISFCRAWILLVSQSWGKKTPIKPNTNKAISNLENGQGVGAKREINNRNPSNTTGTIKRVARNVDASIRPGLPASSSLRVVSSRTFWGVKRAESSPRRRTIGTMTRSLKGCESSICSRDVNSPRSLNSARRAINGSTFSSCSDIARLPITTT